jgi:hypothetical protein
VLFSLEEAVNVYQTMWWHIPKYDTIHSACFENLKSRLIKVLFLFFYFYSDLFYVRNHLPVPEVDPETYSLEITGIGVKTMFLSLHDIKTKFPKYTVTAAVQCAGNRRSEMSEVA